MSQVNVADKCPSTSSPLGQKRRRRVKRGLFGLPKRNRILFIVNVIDQTNWNAWGLQCQIRNTVFILFCFVYIKRRSDSSDDTDTTDEDYDPNSNNERQSQGPVTDSSASSNKNLRAKLPKSKSFPLTAQQYSKSAESASLRQQATNNASTSSLTTDWADGLPFEILVKIFGFYALSLHGHVDKLRNLSDVCRNWQLVSDDASLWRTLRLASLMPVEFASANDTQAPQPVPSMSSKVSRDRATRFASLLAKLVSSAERGGQAHKFKHVHALDLSHLSYLTRDSLELVLSACDPQNVKELDVSHCHKINASNGGVCCVDVSGTEGEKLFFEDLVATHCPMLKKLSLAGLDVSFFSFAHFALHVYLYMKLVCSSLSSQRQLNQIAIGGLFKTLSDTLTHVDISHTTLSVNIVHQLFVTSLFRSYKCCTKNMFMSLMILFLICRSIVATGTDWTLRTAC